MKTPHWALLWFLLMFSLLGTNARAQNPIQLENAKPGTSAWQVSNYASNHQIEGYANLTSINRGGQIEFFVNTIDPTYTIQIFRMGWYGGAGARLITSISQVAGTAQPACPSDATTGLTECNWTNPYVLQIPNDTSDPTDWCSGVYLAKLTGASGYQSFIVFDVRDDGRASNYLFQNSATTYEAYNNWGGKSLYAYNSTDSNPARKVSFNRPYSPWDGAGQFMDYEYPMVRFLEREGYDVTYATDVDIDGNGGLLLSHKADLIAGHGEYWSWNVRNNVQAALAQGVSLGFFSANTCYWQVRYEPSVADGTPNRTVVGYKGYALTEDPYYIDGNTAQYPYVTTLWRGTPVNRPEDALIGVLYANVVSTTDIVVYDASNWVFQNTGLQNGSHITNVLGVEVDGLGSNTPPGIVLLSKSPYQIPSNTITYDAAMTVYTAPSGATVFAAGTMTWSWGLDGWSSAQLTSPPPGGTVSAAAQQMTRNVLARFASSSSSSPTITLSPSTLAFPPEPVGTVSTSLPVTVTNTGTAAVSITSISISGTNAADFTAGSSNCGNSLAAEASCKIPITFTPTTGGNLSAVLTITDNAAGSPQTENLAGTGSAFALTSPSGQTTATINAGQTASLTLSVVPTAFNGNVNVTCSGAPQAATCTVSPGSVSLSGSTAAQVTVTVATTVRSSDPLPGEHFPPPFGEWIAEFTILILALLIFALPGKRFLKPSLAVVILLLIACLGCGTSAVSPNASTSNSNTGTPSTGAPSGTPAGTSTLTVTATGGSVQTTLPLTLTVK